MRAGLAFAACGWLAFWAGWAGASGRPGLATLLVGLSLLAAVLCAVWAVAIFHNR